MVKVIKAGTWPVDKTRKVTCKTCKSVLEVKDSEWQSTEDVREPSVVCVDCPICKHKIYRNQ
jgi:RNase P subunit RPR2